MTAAKLLQALQRAVMWCGVAAQPFAPLWPFLAPLYAWATERAAS